MNRKKILVGGSVLGGVLVGATIGVIHGLKKKRVQCPKNKTSQKLDDSFEVISKIKEKKKNINFFVNPDSGIVFGEYFGKNNGIVDLTTKQYFVLVSDEDKVGRLKDFVKERDDIGRLNIVFIGKDKERKYSLMRKIKKHIDVNKIYFYDSDFLLMDFK